MDLLLFVACLALAALTGHALGEGRTTAALLAVIATTVVSVIYFSTLR